MNRADTSLQSIGSQGDLSLGSFASEFLTPARRAASGSTATSSVPVATPSPPNAAQFTRRRLDDPTPRRRGLDDSLEDNDGDVLDTPGREHKWGDGVDGTPAPDRTKRGKGATKGSVNLTLRDQEKHIDSLKKENFNIKLKVHFLEERLAQLAPDQIDEALKQNINLKIEVQQRGMEIKKLKKLVLEAQRELERLQRGSGTSESRVQYLEEKLAERDRELSELRRRRVGGADEHVVRELEARNAQLEERNMELEEQLEGVRTLLEDNAEEMERLKEIVESREDERNGDGGRLRKHLEELEDENEHLKQRVTEHEDLVVRQEEEKEELVDQVEMLRLQLEDMERRREAENVERSQSRAMILDEREGREAVEEELASARDKLAAAQIEIQQKEDEVELKVREIDEIVAEHERIVREVEQEWRGEVEEARGRVDELKDELERREQESKELRLAFTDLETEMNEVVEKFEIALEHKEREAEEKDSEIASANQEIQKLGDTVYRLEDENDRLKEESARLREEDGVELERLEALSNALKEKVANLKEDLEDLQDQFEQKCQEANQAQASQEELAKHIENLVAELQKTQANVKRLESERDKMLRELEEANRQSKRALEAKDSALQSALHDLTSTQALLSQRESDLAQVQAALDTLEKESKQLGESHTTARFSLQLEVDRLKRDVERLEDELRRARKELDERDGRGRDREGVLDRLHAENRDLAAQLAAQTQARLNATEKLDGTQASLKAAEAEAAGLRARVQDLEGRMSKDQRSMLTAETQYRDQLTERNTLLLTIYQYMDKILGVDKTPKKNGAAETKPFTNFSVFHDNLITRLKQLSQIALDFDRRAKDAEARYAERLDGMRKQLDARWRQLDKFEAAVKALAEHKAAWRRKLVAKEGEADALRATNAELQAALAAKGRGAPGDGAEVRALNARATNAERRVANLQNQLLAAEERVTAMNQKTAVADNKWEVRVKEYEGRLKQAEEKVKRERQGGKERAHELEAQARQYQRQIELAQKRIQQLNEILDKAGLGRDSKNASPAR
ncbi:anucleate primary sterigmata protein B [Phanerochaete sordida]|uniref:Anucleate primary sterigmata protein B n=1 Tax=Phanerochaete sordida TaxID=48140 RepID=A0A9P3G4N0_9APHY|nr:anucleate primary sterigmata protein B [Phanerochaete sordida]